MLNKVLAIIIIISTVLMAIGWVVGLYFLTQVDTASSIGTFVFGAIYFLFWGLVSYKLWTCNPTGLVPVE